MISESVAPVPEIHLLPGTMGAMGAALSELSITLQMRNLPSAICC